MIVDLNDCPGEVVGHKKLKCFVANTKGLGFLAALIMDLTYRRALACFLLWWRYCLAWPPNLLRI